MGLQESATNIRQGTECLEINVEPSTRIGSNNAETFADFAEAAAKDVRDLAEKLHSRGNTWLRWANKTTADATAHTADSRIHYLAAKGEDQAVPLIDELIANCDRISAKVDEAKVLTPTKEKIAEYVGRLTQLAADIQADIMRPAKAQWLLLSGANDIVEITLSKAEEAVDKYTA